MRVLTAVFTFLICSAAVSLHAEDFSHDLENGPKPWKSETFDTAGDRFMFAVHADLTGGERPHIFETAMRQLSLLRPEFVISAGDLIEGGGDHAALVDEWESFEARAELAGAPLFFVGGNHDLSSELERVVWAERHGPHFYHFVYKNALFLVLDSEDMTANRRSKIATARAEAVEVYKTDGPEAFAQTAYATSPERTSGAISDAQADYFVSALAANPGVRHSFVFVHKPVWQAEKTPYTRIEAALAGRAHTVFNGHVHVYEHRVRNGADHIQVATTAGEQFPEKGMSEDHVTLVTVSGEDVSIATLLLEGIRDKKGAIPSEGHELCFATAECGEQ